MTPRTTLCLVILWLAVPRPANAQQFVIDDLTTIDGLPENSVATMLQDLGEVEII